MSSKLRVFLGLLIAVMAISFIVDFAMAAEKKYPYRPITMVIPSGVGGSTDTAARALIISMQEYLGVSMIPVNITGGALTVGAAHVVHAKPDGYTMGAINLGASLAQINEYFRKVSYKYSDFRFIGQYTGYILGAIVHKDRGWKDFQDFVKWARKRTNFKYEHHGRGNVAMLMFEEICSIEGLKPIDVPALGSSEMKVHVMGKHIPLAIYGLPPIIAQGPRGPQQCLWIIGRPDRDPNLPDIPSVVELYPQTPNVDMPVMLGVPAKTPDYKCKILEDAFVKAINDPQFIELMTKTGNPVIYRSGRELEKHIEGNIKFIKKMYKKLGYVKKK